MSEDSLDSFFSEDYSVPATEPTPDSVALRRLEDRLNDLCQNQMQTSKTVNSILIRESSKLDRKRHEVRSEVSMTQSWMIEAVLRMATNKGEYTNDEREQFQSYLIQLAKS